ncbi:MAG: hypothetical protein AAF086_08630 [Planctomycetota bacterium]
MNTPAPTTFSCFDSPRVWLSRWAALLTLLLACGVITSSIAPAAWADDHEEREEYDEDEDEDWEDEDEELEWFMVEVELYAQLLDLVLTFEDIASDAGTAGVAAVMAVEEHVDEPADAAALYEEMLPQVTNATVERAIRLKLVDVYAEMDQPEKSVEQLKQLIAGSAE